MQNNILNGVSSFGLKVFHWIGPVFGPILELAWKGHPEGSATDSVQFYGWGWGCFLDINLWFLWLVYMYVFQIEFGASFGQHWGWYPMQQILSNCLTEPRPCRHRQQRQRVRPTPLPGHLYQCGQVLLLDFGHHGIKLIMWMNNKFGFTQEVQTI